MHFLMINVLVDSLEKEGFTVAADHVGHLRRRPAPIGDYIPDIEATRGDDLYLIEVETQSTLGAPGAQQLAALASQAPAKCYVAVPFDCIERARGIRECLELKVGILPCYPFVRYVGVPK